MVLMDDLSEPLTEEQLERRKLLATISAGALATAAAGTAITAIRYLSPGVLYEASSKLKAGPVDNIPIGAMIPFPKQKVYVVRNEEGVYALSSTCTHLGCMTRYEPDHKRVFCPCHGSQFDLSGKVVGGPAPKPLPRLKVAIEKGIVVVDANAKVGPDDILKV